MHRQKEIRREVKHQLIAGLDDASLTHFSFTEEELASLEWKHDKEFKHEGLMYDIVKREKTGDVHHFWCWKDDKETELYQQFESMLAGLTAPIPEDQQSTLKWLQFQTSLYCNSLMVWQPKQLFYTDNSIAIPYTNLYHSLCLEPSIPPPLAV